MGRGIFYIVLSGICYLILNFFVKILGAGPESIVFPTSHKIPTHEIVFFRSAVSFILCFALLKQKGLSIFGTNKKWLLIRGFSGMIALTLFFYTIQKIPLAIASSIQYLAPIFTIIIAVLFFGEIVKKAQWVFISISFLGALILGLIPVFQQGLHTHFEWYWILIGVVSAVFSGIAYNAIIKLKKTDSPLHIVIYFPMVSLPVMGIWCLFDFVVPKGIEWVYLLLIGVFTQFAQILMTKALHIGNASTITPFQYLGSIYALFVGLFVFGEFLSIWAYVGISLILLGVLLNIWAKYRVEKSKQNYFLKSR